MSVEIIEENGKKIYYVDVGDLSFEEVKSYIEEIKKKSKNNKEEE